MKQYEVTGPFGFRGHSPGETFEAKPDEVIERALNRGSISPVKSTPASTSSSANTTPAKPEKE